MRMRDEAEGAAFRGSVPDRDVGSGVVTADPLSIRVMTDPAWTLSLYDADVVLGFENAGVVTFPAADDDLPVGMQTAIMSWASTVLVDPEPGVFVLGSDALVVPPLHTAIFIKVAEKKWLMSLGVKKEDGRTPPSPPVLLTAVGGVERVDVTWSAPSSTGGAAITQYVVESSVGGVEWLTSGQCDGSVLALSVSGNLTPGVVNQLRVLAVNAVGFSDPSNVLSATPVPIPPGPQPPLPPSPFAGTYDVGAVVTGIPLIQSGCYDWKTGKVILACGGMPLDPRGLFVVDPLDFAAAPTQIDGTTFSGGYPFAVAASVDGAITVSRGDYYIHHRPAGSVTWSKIAPPTNPNSVVISGLAYDENGVLWCSATNTSTGQSAFGQVDPVAGTVGGWTAYFDSPGTAPARYAYSLVSNYAGFVFAGFVDPAGTGAAIAQFNTKTRGFGFRLVSDFGGVAAYDDLVAACRYSEGEMTVSSISTGLPDRVVVIPKGSFRAGVMNLKHPTKGRYAYFVDSMAGKSFTPYRIYY